MRVIEILSLFVMLMLGLYASAADIRKGIIKNRIIAIAASYAIVADIVYYGFLAHELAPAFLINAFAVVVIALVLFYTHSWAGGDCKLLCVMALLYPANFYLSYNHQSITLFFAVAFAFLLGYGFLVVSSIWALLSKHTHLSVKQIGRSMRLFLRSYIQVLLYLTAVHLIYSLTLANIIQVRTFALLIADFCLAWVISSVKTLQRKCVWIPVLVFDVIVSIWQKTIPVGTDFLHYLFIFAIVLLRIMISEQNYQTIPTAQIQRGMILSTATSMLFAGSRVKGLPGISTEDLRSRLTEEEAASIKRWEHSASGQAQITIVRKIPFAIFICLGFLLYFIVWSVI